MDNKLLVSIVDEDSKININKDFSRLEANIEFSSHSKPKEGTGGSFHVLYGLLIGVIGARLLDNIFTDLYSYFKEKIFSIYKNFKKEESNKVKVFNFILYQDNLGLMFIFEFELPLDEFDKRYKKISGSYNEYFQRAKNNNQGNWPLVFHWDEKLNDWVVIENI